MSSPVHGATAGCDDERVSATTIIDTSAEVIFAILADPAKHAAIDGTG